MKLRGSSGLVGNHTACHVGPHNVSKKFGPVGAPYFHKHKVFLLFCSGRRPVDRLAGAWPLLVKWHIIRVYLVNITRRWPYGSHRALYGPA